MIYVASMVVHQNRLGIVSTWQHRCKTRANFRKPTKARKASSSCYRSRLRKCPDTPPKGPLEVYPARWTRRAAPGTTQKRLNIYTSTANLC